MLCDNLPLLAALNVDGDDSLSRRVERSAKEEFGVVVGEKLVLRVKVVDQFHPGQDAIFGLGHVAVDHFVQPNAVRRFASSSNFQF